MEKYFKPLEIIKWFQENQDNTNLLETYGFHRAWDSYIRDGKHFFNCELDTFLRYLKRVYVFNRDVDNTYDPEVIVSKETGYDKRYLFNGESCDIDNAFMSKFIYDRESFKDKIKSVQMSQLNAGNILPDVGEGTTLPVGCEDKTIVDMESYVDKRNEDIENLKKNLEAEIKKKEEEFDLIISKMKLQMAETMKSAYLDMMQAKTKVANMESYFYRYLSYHGQTFDVKKLCGGKSGEGSLVIWQKLRYLDEELPRLCALDESSKHVDFNDFTSFEKLLVNNKYVREFFLPSQKCVVAFQLSKSGVFYRGDFVTATETTGSGRDTKIKVWLEYVETAYNLTNWNKLGLFFRNGDNVYVAWLDKDKINIIGDSLFVTNSSEDSEIKCDFKKLENVDEFSESSKGSVALRNLSTMDYNNDKRISMYNKYMSRVYVVDILQGILDNKPEMLELPEGQNVLSALVNRSYKDIIFNNADGYIEDLKWKNFKEVYEDFKLKDEDIKYGYDVYVLTNDGGKGRGRVNAYIDRTNDATLHRGLNKINMIDFRDTYYFYKNVDKNDFELMHICDKDYYVITKGDLKDYSREYNRVGLWVIYKDGTRKGVCWDKFYLLKDGTISDKYKECKDIDKYIYGYEIENFEDVVSGVFSFEISNTDEYRRVDEPLVPRYSKSETSWDYNERKYVPKQVNQVYEDLMNRYKAEVEKFGFVEDKSKRERDYYFYVRCDKSWSDSGANVQIEPREFITLKNITSEHLDYMISHKFVLPCFNSFSDSLKAYLEIKEYINNRDKK